MFDRKDLQKQNKARSSSVFIRLQRPLLLLAILNACILALVLYTIRVPYQLNKNSYDLCQKQIDNRKTYLQTHMTDEWIRLKDLTAFINEKTESMIREDIIQLEKLDSSTAVCTPLILDIIEPMIQKMYTNKVSGIYIVFNTHDMETEAEAGEWKAKTGIYLRDKDPMSASSEKYADILLECSPTKIVQEMSLSTDQGWEQNYKFSSEYPYGDWLTKPFQMAMDSKGLSAEDCGLWSIKKDKTGNPAFTYSLPLILPDGQVYGILGIEILPAYMEQLLPYGELDQSGMYGLMFCGDGERGEFVNGQLYSVTTKNSPFAFMEPITLFRTEYNGFHISKERTEYEAFLSPLSIYSRNTPFENQKWYVFGAVPTRNLFAFTNRVEILVLLACLIVLIAGSAAALYASWRIAKPIKGLQKELADAQADSIPNLSRTGITEVDDFATAIISLSQSVVNSSKRFLSIMEMSSIEMGGYELDEQNDFVFLTNHYFALFNRADLDSDTMTPKKFIAALKEIQEQTEYEQTSVNSFLYSVTDEKGTTRYIHVEERQIENRRIGVAEDVTLQILEKKHLERERDFDLLTGIFNRRAFENTTRKILEKPAELGISVAIMLDLDNLKSINDSYGHEWGDHYIVEAAKCIERHLPVKSVCARVSGDEFNIFMYGFGQPDDAIKAVQNIWNAFAATVIQYPDGIERSISASGGYVFLNENETDLFQMIKYADFAMYRIKKENKGGFGQFDLKEYLANEEEKARNQTFRRIVQNQKIHYVFQPIISAKTGKMFACEALMRIMAPERMNLAEFLQIAKKEGALADIEYLTWFNALPTFQELVKAGKIGADIRLFLNTQVNYRLKEEYQKELISRFGDIRDRVVMEVLETDDLAEEFSQFTSQNQESFSTEYALDDYGTGYNSEKNLISLMPKYIKVDMSLIRDVEKYQERQKLISGLISFAHEKDMLVLAEGVETIAELNCLLTLGVDLFQGYLFAYPTEIPGELNQEAVDFLQTFRNKMALRDGVS